MDENDKNIGLYIHIPFCRAKCHYCDFNSFAGMEEYIEPYFKALKCEIDLYREKLRYSTVNTIYIGGGTPTSMDAHYIYEVIDECRSGFNLEKEAEISIEANPGTLNLEKLSEYKAAGINRLSIGLQAWQDSLLESMGRIHRVDAFIENFKLAREAGFNNINVDLIFGLPGQTISDWNHTLYNIVQLNPEHVSCYGLKIEEGTLFGEKLAKGLLTPADDELDREMYYCAIKSLGMAGFKHYEISNFARPGFESRHNLIYWNAGRYIGLGAGAHSYFGDRRFSNLQKPEDYICSLSDRKIPSTDIQIIDREESIKEYIILGLRLTDGLNVGTFQKKYDRDIFELFGKQLDSLLEKGLLQYKDGTIKLTSLGLDLADQVFIEFI